MFLVFCSYVFYFPYFLLLFYLLFIFTKLSLFCFHYSHIFENRREKKNFFFARFAN